MIVEFELILADYAGTEVFSAYHELLDGNVHNVSDIRNTNRRSFGDVDISPDRLLDMYYEAPKPDTPPVSCLYFSICSDFDQLLCEWNLILNIFNCSVFRIGWIQFGASRSHLNLW